MFKKNIPVNCAYCDYGYMMSNGEHCICEKYGMIRVQLRCSKFLYNPLKRRPSPPIIPESESQEELTEVADAHSSEQKI